MADDKAANQSWRKKPRKFHSKSRLGCKTCKIRHIKCDLARPSCMKCQTTGRTCDGYNETGLVNADITTVHAEASSSSAPDLYSSSTTLVWPRGALGDGRGFMSHNPGPFIVLPATAPALGEAMSFFQSISVQHLSQYRPTEAWSKTLMFFCQTVPAVRHAAVALALVHRSYHQGSSVQLSDKVPLFYYNKAIQLLLAEHTGNDAETKSITLLVCYLFTCFDNLTQNYTQALAHLRGGAELSRGFGNNNPRATAEGFFSEIVRQIRRLDMQTVAMITDWDPIDFQDPPVAQLSLSSGAFESLEHASNHLQPLIARVMRLHWTSDPTSLMDQTSPEPRSSKSHVLQQLQAWLSLFENMLQSESADGPETHGKRTLLRLQHTTMWIVLNSIGPGREMEFDKYLPEFKRCVAMADDMTRHCTSSAGFIFTPEVGVTPVLYIIGVKCRHPVVRRQAVNILRWRPIREAVWDSLTTALVVERVIEIEERRLDDGQKVQGMDQIPVQQRIDSLSWRQEVNGQEVTSLGFAYTLCMQDEEHIEAGLL
ncbi:c6 transcription [Fusarium austroafricanum]|uniref:C6 transcription n=1 Tax=Fusarium austroafricanum TaxID=2364996 RepID=A0A8H4JYT1_9HYPO|nr:c6 transcription [Fusarium austroafricanum]